MSIVLLGSTSGSCTLQEQAVAGTTVLTLPAVSGTILTTTSPKAGNVLQVLSTTKTDTFSYATDTLTDITGLSVSITPTSAVNKILVMCQIGVGGDYWSSGGVTLNLVRGSTNILVASANGNSAFFNAFSSSPGNTNYNGTVLPIMYLDSPATTSAITYKLQVANPTGSATCYINRTAQDQTNSRSTSTITVMEIAG